MYPYVPYVSDNIYVLIIVAYVMLSLVVGFTANWLFHKGNAVNVVNAGNQDEAPAVNRRQPAHVRGRQNRLVDEDDTVNEMRDPVDIEPMVKMGTKKRAKLEAKAERKIQREAEAKLREERKQQQEEEEKEKIQKEKEEKLEEQKREEEQRKAEEEQRRREEEEYRKLKESFSVEGEGYEAGNIDEDGGENLLQKFINHLKENKVVMVEDVACIFRLKVQSVLDRIQQLQADGLITGVIDDRGKFIYITEDELSAVADFVKKRGRVSLQELVENSNHLITLNQRVLVSD